MKILYHHRTLGHGAEGIHIASMVNAFKKLDNEVKVFSLIGEDPHNRSSKAKKWENISRVMPKFAYEAMAIAYNVVGYFRVRKIISEFRPDFVYERYSTHCFSGILACRRKRIPHILEVNSPLSYEQKNFQGEKRLLTSYLAQKTEAWICKNSSATCTVSSPLRDYLIEQLRVPVNKLHVLPNGADIKLFNKGCSHNRIREKYNLGNKIVIGFTGEFKPWHGLDNLIYSFASCNAQFPQTFLLLVGDGPSKDEMLSIISNNKLQNKVAITGKIDHSEIADYIDAMDIAVSPHATFYASPMKLMEYMAMSCAVLAPRMANIEDIITDGKDGLLFSPGDRHHLTVTLMQLIEDATMRGKIGKAAREKVENSMTWEYNAERVIQLAKGLIKKA